MAKDFKPPQIEIPDLGTASKYLEGSKIDYDSFLQGLGGIITQSATTAIANTQNIDNENNLSSEVAIRADVNYVSESQYNTANSQDNINNLMTSFMEEGLKGATDILALKQQQQEAIINYGLEYSGMVLDTKKFNEQIKLDYAQLELDYERLELDKDKFEWNKYTFDKEMELKKQQFEYQKQLAQQKAQQKAAINSRRDTNFQALESQVNAAIEAALGFPVDNIKTIRIMEDGTYRVDYWDGGSNYGTKKFDSLSPGTINAAEQAGIPVLGPDEVVVSSGSKSTKSTKSTKSPMQKKKANTFGKHADTRRWY